MDAGHLAYGIFAVAAIFAFLALFFLPTIIGSRRSVPYIGLLAMGNMLFGFTGIGWFAAFVYACVAKPMEKPMREVKGGRYFPRQSPNRREVW